MTAEDADRLKRLARGSVDELSIRCAAVKATFERDGERHNRRLVDLRTAESSDDGLASGACLAGLLA